MNLLTRLRHPHTRPTPRELNALTRALQDPLRHRSQPDPEQWLAFSRWYRALPPPVQAAAAAELCRLAAGMGVESADLEAACLTGCPSNGCWRLVADLALAFFHSSAHQARTALSAWAQAPRGRRQRRLARQLFVRLVDTGQVRLSGAILAARPAEVEALITAAVREWIDRDYLLMLVMAQEVLAAGADRKTFCRPGRTRTTLNTAPVLEGSL